MTAKESLGVWVCGSGHESSHADTPTLPNSRSRARAASLAPALILLGAVILRAIPWLTNYPLHRDEALYGYWARLIASGRDPLLLTPWIDKPPLALYLSAASIRAFGASELALRLPGIVASLLTVLVTFGFARRAYGLRVALVAAGLVAISPFAILFAPTAFTDPWLTLWLVAAAWAALARRPFLAGLLLGLAIASKQQGVLGGPLVVALLVTGKWQMANGKSQITNRKWQMANGKSQMANGEWQIAIRYWLSAVLGFALIFAPLTYWDSLRWINRPSFWDRSLATYGRLSLAPLAEWPQRAADWATQLGYLYGLPALSALMLLVAAAVGLRAILSLRGVWQDRPGTKPSCVRLSSPPRAAECALASRARAVMLNGSTAQRTLRRVTSEASRSSTRLFPKGCYAIAGTVSLSMLSRQPAQSDTGGVSGQGPHLRRSNLCHAGEIASGYPPAPVEPGDYRPRNDNVIGKRVDVILALYTAGYLALHFAITFQPWDRYLLPILPWVCVLAARGLVLAWERLDGRSRRHRPLRTVAPLLLVPLLLYAAWLGVAGPLPVGSDHGAYAGLEQAVSILRSQPADAVIYHRWLSWHYDFYLFDAPQERRWWGSGWKLADDAAHTARTKPERGQWVVLPDWESSATEELHLPLSSRGLALVEPRRIYRPDNTRSFTVYRIAPLRARATP